MGIQYWQALSLSRSIVLGGLSYGIQYHQWRPVGLHGTLLGGHAGLQYWEALHVRIGRPHGIQYREALWVYSIGRSCGSTVLGSLVSHTAVGFVGLWQWETFGGP